jgi:P-type conjugative transfer protein TrbJ
MGVSRMFQNGGNIQGMLSQFQNVNYWLQSPPTSYQFQYGGSVAQKQANDALWNGIQAQQQQIASDAQALDRLQSVATTTQGQKQALDAANSLAALEQKQLLQIRQLLLQEQQTLAARTSTQANSDAMSQASTEKYYGTVAGTQNAIEW